MKDKIIVCDYINTHKFDRLYQYGSIQVLYPTYVKCVCVCVRARVSIYLMEDQLEGTIANKKVN
jgi:hypothetical protein